LRKTYVLVIWLSSKKSATIRGIPDNVSNVQKYAANLRDCSRCAYMASKKDRKYCNMLNKYLDQSDSPRNPCLGELFYGTSKTNMQSDTEGFKYYKSATEDQSKSQQTYQSVPEYICPKCNSTADIYKGYSGRKQATCKSCGYIFDINDSSNTASSPSPQKTATTFPPSSQSTQTTTASSKKSKTLLVTLVSLVVIVLIVLAIKGIVIINNNSSRPPTIIKVDPNIASAAGGTEITITGTGFKANLTPTVTIGGNPATGVKVTSKTTLKATVPPGVAGPADIVVANAKAKVKSLPYKGFTYYEDVAITDSNPDLAANQPEGIDATAKVSVTLNQDVGPTSEKITIGNDTEEMVLTPAGDSQMGSKEIIGKDGAPMVLIPAGEFQMGSNDGGNDEKPVHTVYIDAFYMDKYEVTNAQYKKFMDATGYKAPTYWDDPNYNTQNNPIIGVSWYDAETYADWAGKRLPTEAEWEKAARGGLLGKQYPWGDTITHDDANYDGIGGKDIWNGTSLVGSFKPNGYGLYDMAGNVLEWVADWYVDNYYANSSKSNPKGPNSGRWHVLRGGSWYLHSDNYLRVAYRNYGDPARLDKNLGFRCAGFK
jgi:formylglycine-generating enzyme required for sulfatase activity/transposase-like protein